MLYILGETQRKTVANWLPAQAAGFVAWLAFLTAGDTPLIRATGLALVIVGLVLTLRPWGSLLSFVGGLALAFCPAFWAQTGGAASSSPATIVLGLVAAMITVAVTIRISQRPYLALGLGLLFFAIIFWSQIGTPRSLRLTGLLTVWLLFLLVDALRASNPRPDENPPTPVDVQHYLGLLIILFAGVLNDPLFVLLLPAVAVGLWLSETPLPRWYWLALLIVSAIGLRGIAVAYIDADWWRFSSFEAQQSSLQVPYLIADGWRIGTRWVDLIELIVRQFTWAGAALSVLGLARMARWYPVLGVVTMAAHGFFAIFGLMYFGADREILLLPLYIVHIIWLTYAVHALGHWLAKSLQSSPMSARWLATAAYSILPLYLFWVILRSA